MDKFISTFDYKLIYVFRINDATHKGLLKIGDATLHTNSDITTLAINSRELNLAAKKRINEYTSTAGVGYELLHTELAVYTVKEKSITKIKAFRDKDVHSVLTRSGIKKHIFSNESKGKEWFNVDLETAKNAITAVKNGLSSLSSNAISVDDSPIIFRPEQEDAIKATLVQFKTSNRMLWNAKMRFGKTLSALEVARRSGYKKTLIFTHRPVVSNGWYEDFCKIFNGTDYVYHSKNDGENIDTLADSATPFVYFASMQDLRGSAAVGGKFEKNELIFLIDWDFIVVDEAHEGTKTTLGQAVISTVLSADSAKIPKMLELSGTPFNLLGDFHDSEIYTWDYIMEQRAKNNWAQTHFGDSNPYAELPQMHIYTYNLDKTFAGYIDIEDSAFNFREFFRTWTGEIAKDYKPMPQNVKIGEFVHFDDVNSFLNLITKSDENTNYPFATEEYRSYFRHTLWMLPGVKEAKAFSQLLQQHPIFGSSAFKIVNVAGAGDEEKDSSDALSAVKAAIGNNPNETYSITLSCGRLTTGVTVPEWTAVMMLAGSFSTAASSYLQTIFRVQTSANINGKIKEHCCVFDFAPDRTLKMVAEAGQLSSMAGQVGGDKVVMGEFLNYCPVISVEGSSMSLYDIDSLLQQLKKAYTDRVVKSGFDDIHIYNDNLLKLDDIELQDFETLKKIVGASKQSKKLEEIDINNQGYTNEEYEELARIESKPKKERSLEEAAFLKEKKKKKDNAQKAMSILRGISIRIPLLVYGADVPPDKEITCNDFVNLIDDSSWNEFMPTGVTKEVYKKFAKYYDGDIFVAAGRQIRNIALKADELLPTERVKKIASLFSTFKNPDKETVLTPWRVVNMHMSDCLGGYDFFDDTHTEMIDEPRFVDRGGITAETLSNLDANILEINSKTGLYPLYVTYSLFRKRIETIPKEQLTFEEQNKLWKEIVENNLFIICKTPMAKSITKRTLLGYRSGQINAHAFDDLIGQLKEKPEQFRDKVLRGSFWNKENKTMKFDAIVGNPPYQDIGGSGGNNDAPIYQCFVEKGLSLSPKYESLIIPARWFTTGRENLLGEFRRKMLQNKHLSKIFSFVNSREVFPSVEIKGGICYFLIDESYQGTCCFSLVENNIYRTSKRKLDDFDVLIREPKLAEIVEKVRKSNVKNETVDSLISNDTPFGISSNPKSSKKNPMSVFAMADNNHNTLLYHIEKLKRKIEYVDKSLIQKNKNDIDKYKVLIPGAGGSGTDPYVLGKPEYAPQNSVCSQSYLYAAFDSEREAKNFIMYIKTRFLRVLVSSVKISQSAPNRSYKFVPLQDFTEKSDIDWSKSIAEIDKQLYTKYALDDSEIAFIESMIKPME